MDGSYLDALEYIHGLYRFGSVLGLERIARLLDLLGNPHRRLKCVHVAGTNGKGSVTAITASIFKQAGLSVGQYISPYIQDFRERISLNGRRIPASDVVRLLERIRPCADLMVSEGLEPPTEFEVVTAMGLLYFAESRTDVAVIEVGLGGRCDATNVIENVFCSVITRMSLDHTDRLGKTLEDVTREKAGILKRGKITVSAPQDQEALDVLVQAAKNMENSFYLVGRDVCWREVRASDDGQVIDVEGALGQHKELFLPLLGRHQQENAVTAVTAALLAKTQGLPVTDSSIREGLARVSWPGRLEVVGRSPLVIIDGAHNLSGIRSLVESLNAVFSYERLYLVFGVLGDKAVEEMVDEIVPLAHHVFVAKPDSPRALDPKELLRMASTRCAKCEAIPDVVEATERALSFAGPKDAVLITGSLYLIGRARTFLVPMSENDD